MTSFRFSGCDPVLCWVDQDGLAHVTRLGPKRARTKYVISVESDNGEHEAYMAMAVTEAAMRITPGVGISQVIRQEQPKDSQ